MSLLSPKYLLVVFGLFLAGASVSAAEYSARAQVDFETFYDGNLLLNARNCRTSPCIIEELKSYELAPALDLRARGQGWEADLNTTLRFAQLSNSDYDSDDQLVDLSLSKFSENQRFDLFAGLERESTRTLAPELGPDRAAFRTEYQSLRAGWTRILNEKNTVALGANVADMEYRAPNLNDYEQSGYDLTWIRQLNERMRLQVGAYTSMFESGNLIESDTIGLTTGLTRQFNEGLTGTLSIGTRRVDTTATRITFLCLLGFIPCTFESESDGLTSSADIKYDGERWSGSVEYSRSLNPSGFLGELVQSDQGRLRYSRRLRPKIYFDFTVAVFNDEALTSGSYTRNYWTALPSVRWQFKERWSLTTILRHRKRDRFSGGLDSDSDSSAIIFRVRYAHPRANWSR